MEKVVLLLCPRVRKVSPTWRRVLYELYDLEPVDLSRQGVDTRGPPSVWRPRYARVRAPGRAARVGSRPVLASNLHPTPPFLERANGKKRRFYEMTRGFPCHNILTRGM